MKMSSDLTPLTKQIISFKRHENRIRALLLSDSKLVGGVKERVLRRYLPSRPEEEFVYISAPNGYAQVALARVGKQLGKKVTIFSMFMSPETKEVMKNGGRVIFVRGGMREMYDEAEKYMASKKSIYEVPFGADHPEIKRIFVEELKSALKGTREPRRLWLVSGSGFTLSIFQEIWPNTKYMIVQVGRSIPKSLVRKQDTLFISPYKFLKETRVKPPYSSPPTYDAKLWEFFIRHGQNGDYIWNTAAEIK